MSASQSPKLVEDQYKGIIKWGSNNRYPAEKLLYWYENSAIHGAICKGKARYLSGTKITADIQSPQVDEFLSKANALESWHDLKKKIDIDEVVCGGYFIKIYSNVDREQLNKFYLESDLFILANYMMENGDTEGCPVVLVEAMSYLLPVIGGEGGGVDTAINDGKNGYIIDSSQITEVANKIILILNDINLIKQMSLYSKKKIISEHNIKVISQKFDNIVFNLCNT
jgi:glycosyltransferase involved in cell wall biosynthesis